MCKKCLRGVQKMEAHVIHARRMARDLIALESRGSGDLENAMRRIEQRDGVPFGFLWSLRYRPPQDVLMGMSARLQSAYERKLDEQLRRLQHERSITEAKTGFAARLVRAADALAGEKD